MTDKGPVQPPRDSPNFDLHPGSRRRNVFVTQLEEGRDEDEENIAQTPIVKEARSCKTVEASGSPTQKTLVLKKEIEHDQVSQELQNKRLEIKERMQALDARRQALTEKQIQSSEQAAKFEKFLKVSEAKRRQEITKYQVESQQNEIRKIEIEEQMSHLEIHKARQTKLHELVKKNRLYEDFLLKMIDIVPENYLEYGMDSPVKAIIRRYETLSFTNETLINNLTSLADEQENKLHMLEMLQRQHDTTKLTMNSNLSWLQHQYDRVQEKNKQLELNFILDKGQFRNQSIEIGSLLLAVTNLAEMCHLKHYGPLAEVELLQKLDMIKEYILEKIHIEKLASQASETTGSLIANPDHPATKEKKTIKWQPSKTKGHPNVVNVNRNKHRESNMTFQSPLGLNYARSYKSTTRL